MIWLGLNDIDQEGVFVTVDGSEISYTNWDTTEPNYTNGIDYDLIRLGESRRWIDKALDPLIKIACILTPDN